MIVEAHERWGCELFSRVHSDREGGLGALSMDLNRVGIAYTHTQGQDPSANGLAENCVSRVTALARALLARYDHDTTEATRRAL